jgi:uncharacterized protein YecE (DUF72 family)
VGTSSEESLRVLVGTSGYSYKQWKGRFYPADLPDSQMLRYYASRFPAVEINNTFYRMPSPELLQKWAGQVPADFTFVLKAARRITHVQPLTDTEAAERFFAAADTLGARLGPVLFQLPPHLRKDLERLRRFLDKLPAGRQAALEFRHASWLDAEIYDELHARGAALCVADTEEEPTPLVATADWGYLRLRRADYDDAALSGWAERISAQPWRTACVFFKHEEEGKGAALAAGLIERLRA